MYAYLQGKITHKSPSLLYLDVNGVCYEVNITLRTYDFIPVSYTHLDVYKRQVSGCEWSVL